MDTEELYCTFKRAGVVGSFLLLAFLVSFGVTLGILHLIRSADVEKFQSRTLVGSIKVDSVEGRKIRYDGDRYLERSVQLKESLERMLTSCLESLSVATLQITSIENEELATIFDVNNRGVKVQWSALVFEDSLLSQSVDTVLKNCEKDIVFDPESVKIGLADMRSGRSAVEFETFLLNTEEQFDLRNVELSSISAPKFQSDDVVCPPLEIPESGSVEPISCTISDYTYVGLTCQFSCSPDLTIFGDSAITCLASGSWDNLSPSCSKYCYRLSNVENGAIYPYFCATLDLIPPGTQCFYYCNSNYALEGGSLTCSTSGTWQGVTPVCKRTCSPLNSPKNGIVYPTACRERRQRVGSTCSFDCIKGYTLSGPPSTVCDVNGRWNSVQPTCRKACPLLRKPSNGAIYPLSCAVGFRGEEEVMEGIVCVYSCQDGYALMGPEVLMCGEGGVWLGREAECKKTCKPLSLSALVIANPPTCQETDVVEGSRCDLQCVGNTVMFGEVASAVCLETGLWSNTDISCYHACTAVPVIYNRIVSPPSCMDDDVREGTECSYECSDSFHRFGNDVITCMENGQWSGALGMCYRRCEKLPTITSGSVQPPDCITDGLLSGNYCEFFCDHGYTLHGLRALTCLDDGSWAGNVPTCKSEGHFMIQQVIDGETVCLTADFDTLGITKKYNTSCEMTAGPQWWITTEGGNLKSVALDLCMAPVLENGGSVSLVECSNNASQLWEWTDDGNMTLINLMNEELFLSSGYVSMNSVIVSNVEDQTTSWDIVFTNQSLGIFEERFGGSCPKLKNSSVIVEPAECVLSRYISRGVTCHFSCLPGFKLYGDDERECVNGRWTNSYPICGRACPSLQDPTRGSVNASCQGGLIDQDTKCTYSCDEMHSLRGEKEIVCLSHGGWSDREPECVETCPPIGVVTHGDVSPKSCVTDFGLKGDECSVECSLPYIPQGNGSVVCGNNHTWTGNLTCLRSCDSTVNRNVHANCTSPTIHEGTVCNYQCNNSLTFIHQIPTTNKTIARVCLSTGMFNTSAPRCGNTCPRLTIPEGGSVAPVSCAYHDVPEGDICKVRCAYGYRFDGEDPNVVCQSDGSWSHDYLTCEPLVSFSLYNDDVSSEICVRTDVSVIGSHLMKEDLNYYTCTSIVPGTTWLWVGNMLRNVLAELCIAVEDVNSPSFSLIIFKECNKNDLSQQWDCENEYFLRLISNPFYMNSGSDDNSYVIAKRYDESTMSEFMWKSSKGGFGDSTGGACMMKIKRCLPIGNITNARVEPASCINNTQEDGDRCNITCDSGYMLNKLAVDSITLNCTSYGAWKSTDSLPLGALPAECSSTCSPLSDLDMGLVEPEECTNRTVVIGTACHYKCDYRHDLDGVDVVVCGENGEWSHTKPYCRTKCRHESMVPGGHPSSPYTEYPTVTGCTALSTYTFGVDEGDTCYYDCPGGMHKLVGSDMRTCLADQNLNGTDPTCVFPTAATVDLSNCPSAPGNPAYTFDCYLDWPDFRTRRLCANYTCPEDHKLIGHDIIQCDVSNYTWPSPPICKRRCDDISFNCKDMYVGQVCYMLCQFGETLSHGYGIYLCQEDGEWNDTVAACIDVDDFFMQVDIDDTSAIQCLLPINDNPPYFNSELIIESCRGEIRARWIWKYTNHVMNLASGLCLTATRIEHGASLYLWYCDYDDPLQQWGCSSNPEKPYRFFLKYHPSVILGTSRALFKHKKEFYYAFLVDPIMLEESNMETTNWKYKDLTEMKTLCTMRSGGLACPPLASMAPDDVSFSPSLCMEEWSPEGQTCSWHCNIGEPASTLTTVRCDNGVWTSLTFLCRHYCAPLPRPANGSITNCDAIEKSAEGATCILECDAGTYPISETARVCQWDQSWSGEEFRCAFPCEPLTLPIHTTIAPLACTSNYLTPTYGMECTYLCMDGFYMSNAESTRVCMEDGSWSGEEPACEQVCAPLPYIAHGSVTPFSCKLPPIQSGTNCTITCENGYLLLGSNLRKCQSDGTWLPEISSNGLCQPQCKRFLEPENSNVVCFLAGWQLDEVAFYMRSAECHILCDLEYTVRGSGIRICGDNGSWTGEEPYCNPREQFLIFLSKKAGGVEKKACISGSGTVVQKVLSTDCESENPFHRWSWFTDQLLKNSGTGLCIMVPNLFPGQRLQMASCNESDSRQRWSCKSETEEWFLRMHDEELYPDFGYFTTDTIWVYDLNLYDSEQETVTWYGVSSSEYYSEDDEKNIRKTICSWRDKEAGGVCSPLPIPRNGKIFPSICGDVSNNISTRLSCSFRCNVGFKLDSEVSVVTCQDNGLWSAPPPNCEAFCYPLTIMPNMVIHPESCISMAGDLVSLDENGISPGGLCTVSCEDEYVLYDNVTEIHLTCLQTGRWSEAQGKCNRICPSITQMHHMTVSPETCFTEEQFQGTVCTLQCDGGYIMDLIHTCENIENLDNTTEASLNCTVDDEAQLDLVEELTKTCMGDGLWSGDSVRCVSICPPILPPRNGFVSPPSCTERIVRQGAICSFYCDEQFMTSDISIRTCDRGKWVIDYSLVKDDSEDREEMTVIADLPTCKRFCVFDVYNDSSTHRSPSLCNHEKVPVGTACMTSCASEYILVGESTSTCFLDGSWDETPGICIKKCTALGPIVNGDLFPYACTSSSLGSGAVCIFTCLNQYALIGSAVTTCDSNGEWSSPPPKCERKCHPFSKLYNGQALPLTSCYGEHIITNDTCQFICNEGFELEGAEVARCMEDGEWDRPVPQCTRHCSPFSVLNATVQCSRDDYIWGTVCTILCDRGLAPSYLAEVSCNGVGYWTPEIPRCVETGVPMYIMQSLDETDICLKETIDGRVVRRPKVDCLTASDKDMKIFQWRWLENFNIQNIATGRCLAAHFVRDDEPIVTSPCNIDDVLQLWECSVENPFRLLLKDTEYSPSTYMKGSDKVVLQRWSDAHSYFTTLSLNTATFSSLCSRRPGGACPSLVDISGGAVGPADECKTDAVAEGVVCQYECADENAILLGDPITQCLGNGLWLSPPPKCVGTCPLLVDSLPPHTYYADPDCVFDEPQYGQICTARCLSGYEMSGNPNRTCLTSGEWSEKLFECKTICTAINSITNGSVHPSPCSSGLCAFSCEPGFALEGVEQIECTDEGTWNLAMPQCIWDTQFQIISLMDYDMSMCLSAKNGSSAKASPCSERDGTQFFKWDSFSRRLTNTESGLCLTGSTAKWGKVTIEVCDQSNILQLWECGTAPHRNSDGLRIDSDGIVYFLDMGAAYSDQELAMETSYFPSSQWYAKNYFQEGTVCSMRSSRHCSPFAPPQYGRIETPSCQTQDSMSMGSICAVECETGFGHRSVHEAECLEGGIWSETPICIGSVICEKLAPPLNGQVVPNECITDGVYSGEICSFQCEDGSVVVGDSVITCQDDGTWSTDPPSCVQVCQPLLQPQNGIISPFWCQGYNVLINSECQFICDAQYKLIGTTSKTCDGNAVWSEGDGSCEQFCPKFSEPEHGSVYPDVCANEDGQDGHVCQFSCDVGFILHGSTTLSCGDGKWSADEPMCIKLNACPVPLSFECDMRIKYDRLYGGVHVVYGTTVTVSCGLRCTLSDGPTTRTCASNGEWNHGTPSCKKKCPYVNVPFGVVLDPVNCNYAWQTIGTRCIGSCFGSLHGLVGQETECKDNGIWSKKFEKCETSDVEISVNKVFMIRQFYSDRKHICLQADIESQTVVSVEADECYETKSTQLWKWHSGNGFKQIESVSSNLCWSPIFDEDGVFLSLKHCNDADTDQVFSCGNIESQESVLRVSTGNLYLASFGSSDTIQLTSSMINGDLEWEAYVVGDDVTDPFQTDDAMSLTNSLCRSVCGRELSSNSGYFSSPAYPTNYIRNVICDWRITLPKRKIILWLHDVSIHQSEVSSDGHCIGDHLLIVDGEGLAQDESNVLGQICGNHRENVGPFIGTHGTMVIRFFSDDSVTSTGFTATWDSEELPKSYTDCGLQQLGRQAGRIVGGSEVDLGEVPWFASLISLQRVAYICGATLVSSQYFVTASDCFVPMDKEGVMSYGIGLDAVYLRLLLNLIPELVHSKSKTSVTSDDGATLVQVIDVIFNEDLTKGSDVALVKIAVELPVGNKAACLPPPYLESPTHHMGRVEKVRDYCIVSGWNSDQKGGERELHIVDFPIISDRDCDEVSLKLFGLTINMTSTICAAHFDGSRLSLCEGDQGSGIMCSWNLNYYVIGVTLNFQLSQCRELNIPKYFARMSIYNDWIKNTINGL